MPITPGSLQKWSRHVEKLRIRNGGAPGASSPSMKPRPRAGSTARTVSAFALTELA